MSTMILPTPSRRYYKIRWLITPLVAGTMHLVPFVFYIFSTPSPIPFVQRQTPAAAPIVFEVAPLPEAMKKPAALVNSSAPPPVSVPSPQSDRGLENILEKEIPEAAINIAIREKANRTERTTKLKSVNKKVLIKINKTSEKLTEQQTATISSSENRSSRDSAPQVGAASISPLQAKLNWQSMLLARLQQARRYPPFAMRTKQEDRVIVRFIIDSNGNLLSSNVVKSQGYSTLDNESLALIKRSTPLPKPPAEMVEGGKVEMVVPIEFFIGKSS